LETAKGLSLGAHPAEGGRCQLRVWAPAAQRVTLRLISAHTQLASDLQMSKGERGYFYVETKAAAGDHYFYIVDGSKPVPDPVSFYLPEGVHGPSEIVDQNKFQWTDAKWAGLDLREYIIYELHVGSLTSEGTFDGVIKKLDYLKTRLGVSVIEIMPVAAFPGERNWGYDGVSPYAVQASYGGPDGFKRLVNAAHNIGLGVMLDVVYNHLGNEGNYLRMFGPYFTDKHKTPWGEAVNYDSPGFEGVREYVVENARHWIREYHIDGLRLDAVQTIRDDSPRHILADIQTGVQDLARELGRKVCVIAESDENDARLVRPQSRGGYGLDGMWSDDFHHAVHTLMTGERDGYYQDFGNLEQLARALGEGYVFQGEHFKFWNVPRGTSAKEVPLPANIICIQNHDQVGNRAKGERLTMLTSATQRKAAAALMLLAPHTPLLFMGEEFDEPAPFQFFTSYGDPQLVEAVRRGRAQEFKQFRWDEVPDPQDPATFERSRLHWNLATEENEMFNWYQELIALRKKLVTPGPRNCAAKVIDVAGSKALLMKVPKEDPKLAVAVSLNGNGDLAKSIGSQFASGWNKVLFAADERCAVAVYAVSE
jgi:maltooligosyltrehalose trehalohydrolase